MSSCCCVGVLFVDGPGSSTVEASFCGSVFDAVSPELIISIVYRLSAGSIPGLELVQETLMGCPQQHVRNHRMAFEQEAKMRRRGSWWRKWILNHRFDWKSNVRSTPSGTLQSIQICLPTTPSVILRSVSRTCIEQERSNVIPHHHGPLHWLLAFTGRPTKEEEQTSALLLLLERNQSSSSQPPPVLLLASAICCCFLPHTEPPLHFLDPQPSQRHGGPRSSCGQQRRHDSPVHFVRLGDGQCRTHCQRFGIAGGVVSVSSRRTVVVRVRTVGSMEESL